MSSDAWDMPRDPQGSLRRWITVALGLSVLAHVVLLGWFAFLRLDRFVPPGERLVPRAFVVDAATIDATLPAEELPEAAPVPTPGTASVKEINIPDDRPEIAMPATEIRVAPQVTEIAKPIVDDRPTAELPGFKELIAKAPAAGRDDESLRTAAEGFLKDAPVSPRQPLVSSGDLGGRAGQGGRTMEIPGLQSLDDALGGGGRNFDPNKPIGIPGGALFDYNSAALSPAAIPSLRKLAQIAGRFQDSLITIEGHTDSFGTAEYNLDLSLRRAESVKAWLVENAGIEPDRILTRGYGWERLIVSGEGTVEEQAPNRRVEVSIKTR